MRYYLLLCSFFLVGSAKEFTPFLSFSSSKSELIRLYSAHKVLPLSGHTYRFDAQSCSVDGFVDGVANEPEMILWRHLVSEKIIGQGLRCMTEKVCLSSFSHRYYKGAMCCRKVSKSFRDMSADLHNIIPTVLKENVKELIELENIVDKGAVARVYLYMMNQYGLNIEKKLLQKIRRWHKHYPVSEWEKELNKKIFQLQGTFNPYIEKL